MPKDVSELRFTRETIETLPEPAQEILRFLGQEQGKAYDYNEIFEGVLAVKGSTALVPWTPFLLSLRAFNLGATLDGLNRAGFVRRTDEGNRAWYYLPEGAPRAPTRTSPSSRD